MDTSNRLPEHIKDVLRVMVRQALERLKKERKVVK